MVLIIIGLVIMLVVLFLVLSLWVYNADCKRRMQNRKALERLEFSSKTTGGEVFSVSQLANNEFTVVNIWGTYCGFCVKEMPDMQSIYEEFKGKDVGVMGIVIDVSCEDCDKKSLEKALEIIEANNISYPNILMNTILREYFSDKVFLVPTTFIVDWRGIVVGEVVETVCDKETLERMIEYALRNAS